MIDNQNQTKEESDQTNDTNSSQNSDSDRNDCHTVKTSPENCLLNKSLNLPDQLETADCPICLTRIETRAYTDSCLHEFCRNCLEIWSHNHNQCPLCRQVYTSIVHNVRTNTEYDRIPVYQRTGGSNTGLLLVNEDIGLLLTPLDSGIYMIKRRQTPHGIQSNVLFLAPNQTFLLQNINSNVTFVRSEEFDYISSNLDQLETIGQDQQTWVTPVLREDQQRDSSHQ